MMFDNKEELVLIGIDPGTVVTGYGVIRINKGQHQVVDFGCIKPPPKLKLTDRYLIIYNGVCELLHRHDPQELVVETQYVDKNVQSAIKLGMARGVVIIAAKKKGLKVFEYTPTEAKLAVVGDGRASKIQVQKMVQQLLHLKECPQPEDAADALALAICHAHHRTRLNQLVPDI